MPWKVIIILLVYTCNSYKGIKFNNYNILDLIQVSRKAEDNNTCTLNTLFYVLNIN